MLEKVTFARGVADKDMPDRSGDQIAAELAGRALLRYVGTDQVHETFRSGMTYVTPTPYAVEDIAAYLALPRPELARTHAIWIDPAKVGRIRGPRLCALGQGIEYLLPDGYARAAVIEPGWAVVVR